MEIVSFSPNQSLLGSSPMSQIVSSPSADLQKSFSDFLVQPAGSERGLQNIEKTINYVEDKFNAKHIDVVNSIKKFEATGSAVALMEASHQGANKSVMVQLCGTVGKKCADNTEQLYKQQ